MEENNDLDIQEMGVISSDFIKVADKLKIATLKIIEKKFSDYPVIIMSKNNINIGSLFIDFKEFFDNEWKYFASYLEILSEKNIINNEKIFKEKYKNKDEYCCLLVVMENKSKIIFIPYPED
jgi:hypothetical protein